jgi:GDPmannose 4,6-dehydratase
MESSFDTPEYTANADGIGTLRILEAVRLLGLIKKTKEFTRHQLLELYGLVQEFHNPKKLLLSTVTLWRCKIICLWMTVNYREAYNMFACNGILFNS